MAWCWHREWLGLDVPSTGILGLAAAVGMEGNGVLPSSQAKE